MKHVLRAAVATCVALMAAATMAVPTFALTAPAFVCEIVADGAHATYSTSSYAACAGHTLVDANHQTMVIAVLGACESTTLEADALQVAFNGDFASDYDWTEYPLTLRWPNDNRMGIGLLPCQKAGVPSPGNAAGAIYTKIPMASNTVFNKQAQSQGSFLSLDLTRTGAFLKLMSGDWHRTAVGAVTRVDFNMNGGSDFLVGTKFAFWQE